MISAANAATVPDATGIRKAHLARLDDRLATAAEELRAQCRYESDIVTPPPPGLVALTFDDGPDPQYTPQILTVLARENVPATFFLIGERVAQHGALLDSLRADGRHLLATHTWSHPNFHDLTPDAQRDELERGMAAVAAEPPDRFFRYPYGNSTCFANELLHEQHYRIVGWHVDSCDWAFDRTGTVDAKEALSCGVAAQYRSDFVGHVASAVRARRGGIVLLHDIHAITPSRLSDLIAEVRRDGFTFVRLDDPRFAPSLR